jgi:hypothetical protein
MAAARITPTTATRGQSTWVCRGVSFMIGEYRVCWNEAGMPHTTSATNEAIVASSTAKGEMPLTHIIVVVVSPMTLPAPPALAQATSAAR